MFVRILLSLLITAVVLVAILIIMSTVVRRGQNASTRQATQPDVLFVVSSRGWQSRVLGWVGILLIAGGIVLVVLAVVLGGSSAGGGPFGVILGLAGLLFLWMARGVSRARLEVTPDSVWVFGWSGAPTKVPVGEIAKLAPLSRNNYGGVIARSPKKRLFSANRLMLGYPQLIDYLHTNRSDLPIPDTSQPF
ncbi:hypothetical protein HII28_08450 [Planctomonas sp. JC2975]|uniref:hypothetical protein n=1 Tax=Planctomonas sp. JC2975 TaxID=2729626 RepID=UPI001475C37B|nr:hypothetical protein [Planctomonas sp. JC2975]NNC11908.1 hypothetical protein [Planctomonas sp. JC2975]